MEKEQLQKNSELSGILLALKTYALVVGIFFIFRLILFLSEINSLADDTTFSTIVNAFLMGVRFDIVISGYIMALPFLTLSIYTIMGRKNKWVEKGVFIFIFVMFTLSFIVAAVDIPYFKQFFSRFSITGFEWLDSPVFVFKMIIEEPRYWLYILPLIVLVYGFYKFLLRIFQSLYQNEFDYRLGIKGTLLSSVLSLLAFGVLFLGVRGRLDHKSPIRIGTAYFSNDTFLNQLGLNPNFTLIKSYLNSLKKENQGITLMNNEKAIQNVQNYFEIQKNNNLSTPISRLENQEGESNQKNVVIIMMESMSAAKMKRHGNRDDLTPFLDSISQEGIYFENTYTAGIHTFNGIFSTLFSYPALFRQHSMKINTLFDYHGIGSAMKLNGYQTIYFTTHDGQFDNVEGFLRSNGFDEVISSKHYPKNEIKTTLGVPDDYLFRFAVPKLNELHQNKAPFMAAFMTASDHGPYYIPDYFSPKSEDVKKQIVEYADYSLQTFMNLASQEDWFENTLFVFVADHGAAMGEKYNISLNYNHSPLIFYEPGNSEAANIRTEMAGQIDIFPSVMGYLNLPFENKTLGINLFKETRPYIYFNADDRYGVIDQDWLLVVEPNEFEGLYNYAQKDKENYINEHPDKAKKMKKYAESNLQTYQYLIKDFKHE